MRRLARCLLIVSLVSVWPGSGLCIPRVEVMDRARAYCQHPWTCQADNLLAPCLSGYRSEFILGDHMGLPYDWGGFVSLHEFDRRIDAGYGAGTPAGGDVASCTTGVDCSGYVSAVWDTGIKYGTWTIMGVADTLTSDNDLLPGDAFNEAGYHITLFCDRLPDGSLRYYEAMPPVTWLNPVSSWSGVSGFDRIRYREISEGGSDRGTLSNPIPIASFPFSDSQDTRFAPSDLFDACSAAPGTDESGREFIYVFELQQPGQLRATVSDGIGVDIDLHLYRDAAERDCFARHDNFLDVELSICGRYYLVLDTWVDSSGQELAGLYDLEVEFIPAAGSCSVDEPYDFVGGLGQACANPNNPAGPFCNPNLDAWTCLYSSSDSFCSKPCEDAPECLTGFPGGCCEDIGSGDLFCLPAAFCDAPEPDGGPQDGADTDGGVYDAGAEDAGSADAGQRDAGAEDAGSADAGQRDAGAEDAGSADAGQSDAGAEDAGSADAGQRDAGQRDAAQGDDDDTPPACPDGMVDYEGLGCAPPGWEPETQESCACGAGGAPQVAWLWLAALLGILRRRRGG